MLEFKLKNSYIYIDEPIILVSRIIDGKMHKIEMKHNGKTNDLIAKINKCVSLDNSLFSEFSKIATEVKADETNETIV